MQTIQDNFGIPISHVVQVDFSGFKGAVNALGGIHMDFKYPTRAFNETPTQASTSPASTWARRAASCSQGPRPWRSPGAGTTSTTPTASGTQHRTGDFGRIKRQDGFLAP